MTGRELHRIEIRTTTMDARVEALIASGHVKAGDLGGHRIQVWDKATGQRVADVREVNTIEGWVDVADRDKNGRLVRKGGQWKNTRRFGDFELRDLGPPAQVDDREIPF